jgi:hypothetical protein
MKFLNKMNRPRRRYRLIQTELDKPQGPNDLRRILQYNTKDSETEEGLGEAGMSM